MKPKSIEEHKRKLKKEAVLGVAAAGFLQLLSAGCLFALCLIPDLPQWLWYIFMGSAVFCTVMIIPGVLLLKGRFRGIEGGELEEASQY